MRTPRAQDVGKENDDLKAVKAMVEEAVGWYSVFIDADAREAIPPQPVLRWRNVTRGRQESEGILVLWVYKGRPVASASVYPWEGSIAHEFVSLAHDAKLVRATPIGWSGHREHRAWSSRTSLVLQRPPRLRLPGSGR